MHQASIRVPRASRGTGAAIHFRDAAQRLGATAAQAEELYPYALASASTRPGSFQSNRDPTCVIPPWHRRRIEQPRQLSIRRLA
jgi:hypothetical protein